MFPFRVDNVTVFRDPRQSRYVQSYHAITLNISGLRRWRADGVEIDTDTPFFLLTPKGAVIESDYPGERETWGIMLNTTHWRRSRERDKLDIRLRGTWVSLPMLTPIDKNHIPRWRRELELLRELFRDRIPVNVARLDLGVLGVVRFVLERAMGTMHKDTVAYRLKKLLDRPETRMRPLAELARRVGYSPEHARKLFRAEFGISPIAYRAQCRMGEAMDMITNTRLTVKEMSYTLGFKHVSHFSQRFKQAFGVTPREAIGMYRE